MKTHVTMSQISFGSPPLLSTIEQMADRFRRNFLTNLSLLLFLIVSTSAMGQVAGWDFDGLPGGMNNFGPSPYAPATLMTNVTSSGLVRGSGVQTVGTASPKAWGGNDFYNAPLPESMASSITNNNFATFTVKADAGFSLSLSDIAAYNVRRTGSGPTNGQWQYQIGAGAFVNVGDALTYPVSGTNAQPAITLSGETALQNVPAGVVVKFRIVSWGASSGGGAWYLNNFQTGNDFILNGSLFECIDPPTGNPVAADVCPELEVVVDGDPSGDSGTLW